MGIFDFFRKAKDKLPLSTEPRNWFFPAQPKQTIDYTSLIEWLQNTPELVTVFNVIIEDTLSDGFTLSGGKNKVKKVEELFKRNNIKSRIFELLFDALPTGDGYWLKRKISENDLKSKINKICKRVYTSNGIEYKSLIADGILDELKSEDEDVLKTREIITVPSNTMSINYDEYGNVKSYIQRVSGNSEQIEFLPDEIIHFKLMPQAGKVYSFTPLKSILIELNILRSIKIVASSEFINGGSPRLIITLPNANPNSPQFKRMKESLEEYKDLTNRSRVMLIGGEGSDIKPTVLNSMVLTPEFKELAKWVTQIIIALWGIPSSRIPNLVSAIGGDSGRQSSDEGYYRKIAHLQDLLEDLINSQLLDEYGVELKFNRSYKQDEIREAQAKMFKVDIVAKEQSLLAPYGIRMKKEVLLKELNLKEEEIEEGKIEEIKYPDNRQEFVNNNDINKSPDKAGADQLRQKTQIQKV